MNSEKELEALTHLSFALKNTRDLGEKQELLLSFPQVLATVSHKKIHTFFPQEHDLWAKIAVYSIIAIQQHTILFAAHRSFSKEKMRTLLTHLVAIEKFYESIGGIVGYHVRAMQLLQNANKETQSKKATFSKASGIDLSLETLEVRKAVYTGICAISEWAEIYPIGGLGSRLNLMSKKQEPLPAAFLPFCGRTLLEGLIRDVQAREFLYYRLFHRQVTIPISMMTSFEKQNVVRIETLCEKREWFGRPKESFFIFPQLSVPVITQKGQWSMKAPFEMNLQPGGHGALWKAAEEKGMFFWLQSQDKKHLLIRQINNPIAGLDFGLLALVGIGKNEKKVFGFASCERLPHAAEGILVLIDENKTRHISNIEYTDIKRFGLEDLPLKNGYSQYPANTNILYANLEFMLPVIKKNPLPGLMLNMKNKEPFLDPSGKKTEEFGGRLESMMQNISDALVSTEEQPLLTFVTYNERKKTISAAKRSFEAKGELIETPEGAFYDLLENAHALLKNFCEARVASFSTPQEYLLDGPSHLFLYHPALGPLYSIIAQKIKKPILALGSELQLEIADLLLENLQLEGSLLITAKNLLGHNTQGIVRYSDKTGKCILKNVRINNRGISKKTTHFYWKNQIKRHESLQIILQGESELYAENICFEGNQKIIVPHGERWVVEQTADGSLNYLIEKPQWKWEYICEKEYSIQMHIKQN